MNRAILVHGFADSPTRGWLQWLAEQLRAAGWSAAAPLLPTPQHPHFLDWLYAIRAAVGEPDDRTVLIGHSLGGTTILHYLQHLLPGQRVAGAVLVGTPTTGTLRPELATFFAEPFRWEKIAAACRQMVGIYADEDPMVEVAQGQLLKLKANASLKIIHARTHFHTDVATLPEALDACLRIPLG